MKKNIEETIQVRDLYKNYATIIASNNLNFTAYKGEIIALLGPNGAGKSTLMNMLAGFLAPTSGSIKIMGKNIAQYPLYGKKQVGFLPEGSPLYADLTVCRFLQYMAELKGLNKKDVLQAAKIANIESVMAQEIDTLSKGYQRRVGFAQSILSNPPVLLLDEPTDGLDPNQKEYMRDLIKQMAAEKTIIISTHLLEEAENLCTRIILLDKGQIKADATLPQLLKQTKCKDIATAFRKLTSEEKI